MATPGTPSTAGGSDASWTLSRSCAESPPMRCVLGLDIGTTSTIGILIRLPGETLGVASRPVTLRSAQIGWAEEDPTQWWANVCEIARELLAGSGIRPGEVAAIGVTGMLPAIV